MQVIKIKKTKYSLVAFLLAKASYVNNYFGNNLAGCGLSFDSINLQDTANWKDKLIKNNDQCKLKTTHKSLQFIIPPSVIM